MLKLAAQGTSPDFFQTANNWNLLDQQTVDAPNIITLKKYAFKARLSRIRDNQMDFIMD